MKFVVYNLLKYFNQQYDAYSNLPKVQRLKLKRSKIF